MKKRNTKLLTLLLTTGVLALTAASGIRASMITSTKTIRYQMEENDKITLNPSGITGSISSYQYYSKYESALSKGYGYARVKLKGYGIECLIVAPPYAIENVGDGKGGGGKASTHIAVYTEKSGRNVKCIGEICTDRPGNYIAVKDGIIYVSDNKGTYETYWVTSDGEHLINKDHANINTQLGYTNDSNRATGYKSVNGSSAEKLFKRLQNERTYANTIYFKIKG